jgi:hypothetical protein
MDPTSDSGRARRPRRATVVGVTAVALMALVGACSSTSGNDAGPVPTAASAGGGVAGTSTTAAFTSTTSAPTTTTSSPSSTTSAPATDGPCTGPQVAVAGGASEGAMGHISTVLVFTNTSAQPCAITGYPGVAGLDAVGAQQTQATRTLNGYSGGIPDGSALPVVTLAPDQAASAVVEGTDVPVDDQAACPSYPALLVTPPNTTESTTVAVSLPGCSPLQVHPVVPGTRGSITP